MFLIFIRYANFFKQNFIKNGAFLGYVQQLLAVNYFSTKLPFSILTGFYFVILPHSVESGGSLINVHYESHNIDSSYNIIMTKDGFHQTKQKGGFKKVR